MLEYSLGELIDKLTIENIKMFRLREKMNSGSISKRDCVEANEKMMTLNENRVMLMKAIDQKVQNISTGKDRNKALKVIRTYGR